MRVAMSGERARPPNRKKILKKLKKRDICRGKSLDASDYAFRFRVGHYTRPACCCGDRFLTFPFAVEPTTSKWKT